MGKRTKTNKRTKTVKRRNRNTKLRYKGGLPHQCTGEYTLTQFGINDVQIQSFRRNVLSPKDCVINALQLIGMLDIYTANLLRITLVGQFGIDQSQIEQIFILYYGYTFKFDPITSFQDVSNTISCLQVGHVAFAGYQDVNGAKHVFLIGRKTDGHVYYIDPQINQICNLSDPQCLQYIANKQFFFLLKNNQTKLTDAEFRSKGFVNVSGGNDVNVGDVVMDTSA
jgi:hypothetical protein